MLQFQTSVVELFLSSSNAGASANNNIQRNTHRGSPKSHLGAKHDDAHDAIVVGLILPAGLPFAFIVSLAAVAALVTFIQYTISFGSSDSARSAASIVCDWHER